MAIYLDGIQATEDNIKEFKVVASGTVTVGTNQYPNSAVIPRPSKLYRNYVILCQNKSGQTLANFTLYAVLSSNILPNVVSGGLVTVISSSGGGQQAPSSIANNALGSFEITSEQINPFVGGDAKIQFNLGAVPTTGTIDWVLIGY